jgi:outer membrane protein assembly factor BamB
VLHAFNAETLEELWNSEENAERDRMGTLVKFVPPLVVRGRVYVPNYDNAVNVYGILPNH